MEAIFNKAPIGVGIVCCHLPSTGQTISYYADDDGDLELGIAHDFEVLSTGDQSGTTNITINGKTHALSNNCVRDNNIYRNGKPIIWARYTPDADIGPNTDGALFWDQWTLSNKNTISFDAASKEIRDSASGFKPAALVDNRRFTVAGSGLNDGTFNVNGAPTTSVIVVDETPTNEAVGATVSLATVDDLIWNIRDQARANNLGGYDDWELANLAELFNLLDFSKEDPAVDAVAFPSFPSGYYWSTTTAKGNTARAWRVYGFYGAPDWDSDKEYKTHRVRLVRS